MKSKNLIKIVMIILFVIFIGFIIIKSSEYVTNNLENGKNELSSNEINNNKGIDEAEIEEKIITEINIVSDINSLTTPKLEDIAKKTFNEYIEKIANFEKSSIGPMPNLLINLELATENDIEELRKNYFSKNNNSKDVNIKNDYIKSNVKHEKFKSALLQYVTEDYFVKYFSQYRNIDGYVGFCNCGGSGLWTNVENAELISRVGNIFNFKLTLKDLELYDHYINGDKTINEKDLYHNIDVALEYVNDRLLVSKYNGEIILEGVYYIENTDASYEFFKDGTVEYSTNMSLYKGTYVNCEEKELIITWEEETTWDIITAEEMVLDMDGTEIVTVINNTKIRVESEHNGEKVINEFIKK